MKSNTGTGRSISDDERRLLVFRAAELSARSENSAVASSFLTSAEQRIIFEAQRAAGRSDRLFFWGGYVGAERRKAIFLPSWLSPDGAVPQNAFSEERERFFLRLLDEYGNGDIAEEYMCSLKLSGSGYAQLSHRDWLGALMALGIKRSVLGDIVTDGTDYYVFAEKSCADYIVSQLCRAGRDAVSCTFADLGGDFAPKRSFQELSFTVASPRADGIIRGLCGVSREKAAQIIAGGLAEINYLPLSDTDRRLAAGDILSVRGYGKFIIDRAEDETKKGRIRVLARKYI